MAEVVAPTLKSIGDLSAVSLCSKEVDGFLIPNEFVLPESSRPSVPYDSFPTFELPVIDLSELDNAAKLTKICEEWGFFQVVNHGVAVKVLERMVEIGHDFFSLPTHEKEKGSISYMNGYGAKQINFGLGTPWVEGITFPILPESNIETFEARIWPLGNPHFRETIYEFARELESLEDTVLQLLAMGLGLESPDFFSQHLKSGSTTKGVHFHFYPPCPDPSKVLGALPHTDPSLLTVLFQDKVSGLQIMAKDGTWLTVQHKPNGLLFFVGDIMQGWSNNRFPAVIHRVVLNKKIPRLSFLHATNPPKDLLLEPSPNLVDDEDPLLYKPFTYSGYMKFKSHLHVQRPCDAKPIDVYAGLANTHNIACESFIKPWCSIPSPKEI